MMTAHKRPVYTADGREVPGLLIAGDDAAARFYLNGQLVSEQLAADYMDEYEAEPSVCGGTGRHAGGGSCDECDPTVSA